MSDQWEILGPRHAVNARGYDLVLSRGPVVRVVETKTVQALSLRDVTKLIWRDATGQFRFNPKYFTRQDLLADPVAASAFHSGNLEVEIVINGPRSSVLRQQFLAALGGQTSLPYLDDLRQPQVANLIITAINQ